MNITEIIKQVDYQVRRVGMDTPDDAFVATANGEVIGSFKTKSRWDAGEAQAAAKKAIVMHRSNAAVAKNAESDRKYQMEKPLSEIEKRWLLLYKKLYIDDQHGSEDDYDKFGKYGSLVRSSIGTVKDPSSHPLAKEFYLTWGKT